MKFTKNDLFIIVPVVVLLLALLLTTGKDNAPPLPADGKHSGFLEQLAAGQSRAQVEKGCLVCHNPQQRPLVKNHPPKEQCLICHKRKPEGGSAAPR
jgi:hypothetical protein